MYWEVYTMNKYAKHFNVVRKIKAIVRLTGRAIRHSKHDISADIACKIQRSAYDYSQQEKNEEYTPPYKSIAKQLQVGESNIYKAAIYNLVEIAKHQKRYREDIIKILTQQLTNNAAPLDTREYLETKLAKLG